MSTFTFIHEIERGDDLQAQAMDHGDWLHEQRRDREMFA